MRLLRRRDEHHEQLARLERAIQEIQQRLTSIQGGLQGLQAGIRQQHDDLAAHGDQQRATAAALQDVLPRLREAVPALTAALPSIGDVARAIEKTRRHFAHEFFQLRKLRSPLGVPDDPVFLNIARPVLDDRRTQLGYDRLYVLWQAVTNVAHLALPAAEIGSYRGGTSFFLARAFQALAGGDRELHVVDTFEGHPESRISAQDAEHQRGKFTGTSYEEVRGYLAPFPRVQIHKGEASEILRGWPEMQFCLVHLDVDLYEPTRECLEYFGPRLAPGGVIVMDDFGAPNCPGVSLAAREFLERGPAFQQWDAHTEQLVLIKR